MMWVVDKTAPYTKMIGHMISTTAGIRNLRLSGTTGGGSGASFTRNGGPREARTYLGCPGPTGRPLEWQLRLTTGRRGGTKALPKDWTLKAASTHSGRLTWSVHCCIYFIFTGPGIVLGRAAFLACGFDFGACSNVRG